MDSGDSDYEGDTPGFRKLDSDIDHQSMFVSEKNAKKRLVIKDGKVIGASKPQAKGKCMY